MRPSGTRSSGWGSAGGGPRPGSPAQTRNTRSKNWRDRLIGLAARHPAWVVGYVDEVWWSRLAQPAMHAWGERLRLHARARAKDDAQPKALACYGLLRTDQDRVLLRFVEGRPVSRVTTDFLAWGPTGWPRRASVCGCWCGTMLPGTSVERCGRGLGRITAR